MSAPSSPDPPRLLPLGRRAVLVEVDTTESVLALREAIVSRRRLDEAPWHGIDEVVPAARTLLVTTSSPVEALAPALLALATAITSEGVPDTGSPPAVGEVEVVEVVVHYDGPDLDEVSAATGLSRDEVVAAHTGTPWRVAFGGFAPGFAYLTGGDPRLVVPRRADPRPSVPAGSVGLAGPFSGIYPRASPGGWQLVGRTDAVLWDVERDPPALLAPGAAVRFVDAAQAPARSAPPAPSRTASEVGADGLPSVRGELDSLTAQHALEVLATGPLALVEDAGRRGLADVGVGRSGAADRGAYALGARLVGQEPGPAAVEVTLGGLVVRATRDLMVALTGAPTPVTVDGRPAPFASPMSLRPGQVLVLGVPTTGLRTYLTVRGGIAVRPVLGSRSHDVLSGLGPPPLQAGDRLPVGAAPSTFPTTDAAPVAALSGEPVLDVDVGPRRDWMGEPDSLTDPTWTVSSRSNRVAIRLQGRHIRRSADHDGRELPSEGLVRGAVQLPPNGEPVLFLADHPVTGGYPVVGVLTPAAADRAAQLRPGDTLRLRWV